MLSGTTEFLTEDHTVGKKWIPELRGSWYEWNLTISVDMPWIQRHNETGILCIELLCICTFSACFRSAHKAKKRRTTIFPKSKFYQRSSNLFRVLIPVPVLAKRAFSTLNLFHYVIPVPKLENQTITSSNLFNHVIPILKLDFESYVGQNKAI